MIGTVSSMKAHRGLVLYKRHNSTCAVNQSKVPLAKRRFWMDCDCQIWIVGRMPTGEVVPRQPTGCTDIKKDEAVRAAHIAQFTKATKAGAVHGRRLQNAQRIYRETGALLRSDRRIVGRNESDTIGDSILRTDSSGAVLLRNCNSGFQHSLGTMRFYPLHGLGRVARSRG
jgi:hypothetical protein